MVTLLAVCSPRSPNTNVAGFDGILIVAAILALALWRAGGRTPVWALHGAIGLGTICVSLAIP